MLKDLENERSANEDKIKDLELKEKSLIEANETEKRKLRADLD